MFLNEEDLHAYVETLPRVRRAKRLQEMQMYAIQQVFAGRTHEPGEYIGAILHISDTVGNQRVLAYIDDQDELRVFNAGEALLDAVDAAAFNTSTYTPYLAARDQVFAFVRERRRVETHVHLKLFNLDKKNGGFVYQNSVNYAL